MLLEQERIYEAMRTRRWVRTCQVSQLKMSSPPGNAPFLLLTTNAMLSPTISNEMMGRIEGDHYVDPRMLSEWVVLARRELEKDHFKEWLLITVESQSFSCT